MQNKKTMKQVLDIESGFSINDVTICCRQHIIKIFQSADEEKGVPAFPRAKSSKDFQGKWARFLRRGINFFF